MILARFPLGLGLATMARFMVSSVAAGE